MSHAQDTLQRSSLVIALDGPAGSGKSSAARLVAERLGFTLLDTGAIYRTLALTAREQGVAWDDAGGLAALARGLPVRFALQGGVNRVFLGNRDVSAAIRTPAVSGGASQVSALPAVRRELLSLQRRFADQGPLVAEGRDMGTVVFPGARVKVFLEAAPQQRALRRHRELTAAGHVISLQEVLATQEERDRADRGREVAPLTPAADAVMLDTSLLTLEQVVARIMELALAASGPAERGA